MMTPDAAPVYTPPVPETSPGSALNPATSLPSLARMTYTEYVSRLPTKWAIGSATSDVERHQLSSTSRLGTRAAWTHEVPPGPSVTVALQSKVFLAFPVRPRSTTWPRTSPRATPTALALSEFDEQPVAAVGSATRINDGSATLMSADNETLPCHFRTTKALAWTS